MAFVQHYRCGAVVLQSTVNLIQQVIKAADFISDTLYLPLPLLPNPSSDIATNHKDTLLERQTSYIEYLSNLFHDFRQIIPKLDIRVLVPILPGTCPAPLSRPIEVIVSSYPDISQTEASPTYRILSERILSHKYIFLPETTISKTYLFQETDIWHVGCHKHAVVGGTFDHLHQGHYLLLAATALYSSSSCLVGVSSGPLLKDKVLRELVEPLEQRCIKVKELLQDMRPGLKLDIVSITDPYGPSITETELDCLIVSEETLKAGEAVNRKRLESGMSQLYIHKIPIIAGTNNKLSSTQQRNNILGIYREQPPTQKRKQKCMPYVIGLTGGTCSGKTSIATYLGSKGAYIINCDRLGHESYKSGTPTFHRLVESFGTSLLDHNGSIDRKSLANIVFSDADKLNLLNQIVWPAIADLMQECITEALREGVKVCVVDAAVMLEAGWEDNVDELWVAFVPENHGIERLMQRNGLSEETARDRISSQMNNEEKIARANVVICSLWEQEITNKQVDCAWDSLFERIIKL
ncbi:Bifunctional coenzyme A synthase [Oopsacas minuta]|uniref:Bifunctional coenzyme A synthase n=1 Tax=Oopsacas minuta TaxID=111878 RepID=A0AAV7JU07_9METZ|nr:Bifunctional coenzyme A synthase [Oopsacas minuta]